MVIQVATILFSIKVWVKLMQLVSDERPVNLDIVVLVDFSIQDTDVFRCYIRVVINGVVCRVVSFLVAVMNLSNGRRGIFTTQ